MLSLNAFKKYVPIILARDVSEETVAYVLENNQASIGVHASLFLRHIQGIRFPKYIRFES